LFGSAGTSGGILGKRRVQVAVHVAEPQYATSATHGTRLHKEAGHQVGSRRRSAGQDRCDSGSRLHTSGPNRRGAMRKGVFDVFDDLRQFVSEREPVSRWRLRATSSRHRSSRLLRDPDLRFAHDARPAVKSTPPPAARSHPTAARYDTRRTDFQVADCL